MPEQQKDIQPDFRTKLLLAQFVQQTGARFAGSINGENLFSLGGGLFTEKEIVSARERFIGFSSKKKPTTEPLQAQNQQQAEPILAINAAH